MAFSAVSRVAPIATTKPGKDRLWQYMPHILRDVMISILMVFPYFYVSFS